MDRARVSSAEKAQQALERYRDLMAGAKSSVFFTAAFGVNQLLDEVLQQDVKYLRYVLLEKGDAEVELLRRDADNRIAVGAVLSDGHLDRWLSEKLTGLNTHVEYIHTKYMLIDALSDSPTLITGSANFSDASTLKNDENMLVIKGDTRSADIYLGEFMRLFQHFLFRDVVGRTNSTAKRYLTPNDSWSVAYYKKGSFRYKERQLFSGIWSFG